MKKGRIIKSHKKEESTNRARNKEWYWCETEIDKEKEASDER